LAVRFEAAAGGTRMHVDAQQPPWGVVRAFSQTNDGSLVHLHNVSGGVLAGDHLTLQIDVGPRSIAQITTVGVRADGELLTCEPAQVLPLTQRYFCLAPRCSTRFCAGVRG